jgi:GcrA cell cycle regulator
MSWTDKKIDTLKRLWGKGMTASQIAGELGDGITRNAVIGKAHRLKLPSRPSPVKPEPEAKPAAHPTPAPKVEAPAPSGEGKGLSLLELTETTCKWPIGHPGDEDFYFCGKPSRPGVPYCPEHCLMAYQAQLPRKDRPGERS